jgi:hypothetical protein
VRVTSVTSGSCYIDKGRAAGLQPGDRVTFFPSVGPGSEGTIRSVSKNSARAEFDTGAPPVQTGDRGEVLLPQSRVAPPPAKPAPEPSEAAPKAEPTSAPPATTTPAQAQTQAPPKTPAHPPWQQTPEHWTKDTPLLAPAFGLSPEERESKTHGRAYVQSQGTWDNNGTSRQFLSGSAGADVTMDNPFGHGGFFEADATVWTRSTDAPADDVHTSESDLRINRLTYQVGGGDEDPTRWQFGRFLQHEFPQLGLLDGVEWDHRTHGGDVVGASAGAMPEPFSSLTSFNDLQTALYYRHAFDEARRDTLGFGYQNTWHEGRQDRNLFVADASLRPSDSLTLLTTAWVDYYGSGDVIKDHGFELTELIASGTWIASSAGGVGLTYSHRRIPEILRSEFHAYDAQSVRDNQLDRVTLNGWYQTSPRVRFDGRADYWYDQDDTGSNYEVGTTLHDLVIPEGDLRASVFYAEGSFSSGPGFRLQGSKVFGRSSANLGYEFVDYAQKDFVGQQSQLAQHVLFGSVDFPLSESTDLSILGDRRFGDQQDSWTLGFLLQWRF